VRRAPISIDFPGAPDDSLNRCTPWKNKSSETLALHKGLRGDQGQGPLHRAAAIGRYRRSEKPPGQLTRISYLAARKQRVMIAMALAKQPVLLIADEPTTART